MAKAKKLPSGSWRVNLYVGKDADGKRLYKSFTDPDRKTAEYMAANYALTRKENQKPLNLTVGEAIQRYIDTKTNILSPSTIISYRKIHRNYLAGILAVNISSLTQDQIQIAINTDASHLSPKTVRCIYGLLTSTLREYLPDFRANAKLPPRRRVEMQIPSADDVGVLLADTYGSPVYTAIVLAALLGLRRSEIGALTWSDYDQKNRTIRINKAVVRGEKGIWVTKAPKSYAGTRLLSVPDVLCQHLDELNRTGDTIVGLNPDQISKRFNAAKRKCPQFTARFHDLRHYNASIMLSMGVPDKYAMERMGQSTPDMLKNVYQHIIKDKRDSVSEQINDYASKFMVKPKMQHDMQHEQVKPQ